MSRIGHVAGRYWLDALIALLVVVGTLELVLGRDSADAPRTTLWFIVPDDAPEDQTIIAVAIGTAPGVQNGERHEAASAVRFVNHDREITPGDGTTSECYVGNGLPTP